jgi:predicted dithiol-disulfide oxidoreductase (DUF899 family)
MQLPEIVTREEWLVARKAHLAKEKELTRALDELHADRRRLPMVRIDEDYTFEGSAGQAGLLGLFEGRRQLVVYHYMFQPEWELGCASCAGFADQIGHLAHLNARTTTFAVVSRAPYAKIKPFRERMGWQFPWYSAYGSRFNYDFHVTLDDDVLPAEYNYRTRAEWTEVGMPMPADGPFDLHGLSCFLQDGDVVYHTYSSYGRGTDGIGFTTNLLDRTALGRQEEWEEPKDRVTGLGAGAGSSQLRYHDEYDS